MPARSAFLSFAVSVVFAPTALLAQVAGPAAPPKAPPRAVTGRVLAANGTPVVGARLRVVRADAGEAPLAAELLRDEGLTTGADGTFRIPDLLAALAPAAADAPGTKAAGTHAPDAPDGSDAGAGDSDTAHDQLVVFVAAKGHASAWLPVQVPVERAEAATIDLGDAVLAPGARLVGRVRDTDGKPVAGARVVATDLMQTRFHDDFGRVFVCAARTEASGIFDLPCALPSGATLTVATDGYFTAVREPVAAGTPLELELTHSGFLDGVVVDEHDRPLAAAALVVAYESDPELQMVRADATGAFRVPRRHPGRWLLSARPTRRLHGARAEGPEGAEEVVGRARGDDAATGLRVVVAGGAAAPDAAAAARRLHVRAVTKGTGAAVRTFRAVATWGAQVEPWVVERLRYHVTSTAPTADGTVVLDGPGVDDATTGAVCVLADGHALRLQRDVAWDEANPSVTVELEPEASIAGVVRDRKSGQPIAGASFLLRDAEGGDESPFVPTGPMRAMAGREPIVSAADGTFRIPQLAAGEWHVVVHVASRQPVPVPPITLQAGQHHTGVVVDVPPSTRVAGTLAGEPIGAGWRVGLMPVPVGATMLGPFATDWAAPTEAGERVAADGTFAFASVVPGHYTLLLHVPAPPRCGSPLAVPIDSFRVRDGELVRTFDMRGDRPHVVRGKLTLPHATVPFENLVVLAVPNFEGGMFFTSSLASGGGQRAFVGRDGAFELPVARGSHCLYAHDLALGTVVAIGKPFEVADADVEQDLAVPLHAVTFTLQANGAQPMATVSRLEVRCSLATGPQHGWVQVDDGNHDQGAGVRVAPGATSVTIALPPGEVTVYARNHADLLRVDAQDVLPPLGEAKVTLPADAAKSVPIELGPPPDVGELPGPVDPAAPAERERKVKR